jgi:hypothetical protein
MSVINSVIMEVHDEMELGQKKKSLNNFRDFSCLYVK